jgi:outer membrane receptor for ferrienterochelin and colicins
VDKSVRNVYNVFASWDHDWSNYHLNVTLNGHIQSRRYSSTYGYADGYSQWDLTTRHTVSMAHFVVEPGLGVENVFNQRDTSPWNANFSTISPGRSFIVSVRLKY